MVYYFICSYYEQCHNTDLELHPFLNPGVEWKAGENMSGAARTDINIILTRILKKVKI